MPMRHGDCRRCGVFVNSLVHADHDVVLLHGQLGCDLVYNTVHGVQPFD